MDDDRAVELYAAFRKSYQTKRLGLETIVAPPGLSGGRMMPALTVLIYDQSVSSLLQGLSNSINDFRRWINTLAAWAPIYDAVGQEEQMSLLVEHITPFSVLSLGAPQALRGRMIFAAASACGHANYQLSPGVAGLQLDWTKHLTIKDASRIGQPWANWRRLAPILGELAFGSISEDTGDYRNQSEHGHPRNIGMGLTASVSVTDHAGGRTMGVGSIDAIDLKTVITVAVEQHALAVRAYDALCDLAREQFEALMAAGLPSATT